jgi:hypothetical protein
MSRGVAVANSRRLADRGKAEQEGGAVAPASARALEPTGIMTHG